VITPKTRAIIPSTSLANPPIWTSSWKSQTTPLGRGETQPKPFAPSTAAGPSVRSETLPPSAFFHRRTLARWVTPAAAHQQCGLAEKARLLRNHGMNPKYFHGYDRGQLSSGCSSSGAVGRQTPHLAEYTPMRHSIWAVQSSPGAGPGQEEVTLALPQSTRTARNITNQYTSSAGPKRRWNRANRRAMRYASTSGARIASESSYPIPLTNRVFSRPAAPSRTAGGRDAWRPRLSASRFFPSLPRRTGAVIKPSQEFAI